jgi:hypothetical protein
MAGEIIFHCDFGCEESECGHERCEECHNTMHSCAGCDSNYCECTEPEWGLGANEITYCSQYCADRYGREE